LECGALAPLWYVIEYQSANKLAHSKETPHTEDDEEYRTFSQPT